VTFSRPYPSVNTSIERILQDHLPLEYKGVLERISSLTLELTEYENYKTYLIRIAQASEICLTEDRLGGEDPTPSSLLPQAEDASGNAAEKGRWREQPSSL